MTRLTLLLPLLLSGCDGMEQSARIDAYDPAPPGWSVHGSMLPVPGTVARGALTEPGRPAVSAFLAERGAERYGIFCAPCHGATARGNGPVARILPAAPPDLAGGRAVSLSDARIVAVIADGQGHMYGYASRVPAPDRWAILAHLRRLQQAIPAEPPEFGDDR